MDYNLTDRIVVYLYTFLNQIFTQKILPPEKAEGKLSVWMTMTPGSARAIS